MAIITGKGSISYMTKMQNNPYLGSARAPGHLAILDAITLPVTDAGIGTTEENQKYLFSGFLASIETDFYSTGKPFMFGAGGKGLDLLRIRLYGRRYGFNVLVKSQRCPYLPGDRDLCPGNIKSCHHCSRPEDCLESGGTTFSLFFPDEGI